MVAPRVLLVLDTAAAWSRGIVQGFSALANERGWTLLHYAPSADLDWLLREWPPDALVLGPAHRGRWPAKVAASVCVNADRSHEGVASVCVDDEQVADLACDHLLSKGFRNVTVFRFDDAPFAVARERRFAERALAAGVNVLPGWWQEGAVSSRENEDPTALSSWLRTLTAPCGVFSCCDAWGRVVARYARVLRVRIPEDLAIVGVDNDAVECEVIAPALSSVAVPWRRMGEQAAALVQMALEGEAISGKRVVVSPSRLVVRRSTDTFAIQDSLVAAAVEWIHRHYERRLTVPAVARAVASTRQRLERRFRATLGRTVLHEIRRTRVERAKELLATTRLTLEEVAERTGFSNASLLGVAFRREVGLPPGTYRRRVRGAGRDDE